jgi:nitroimidazol reductase NimA-like FMN-containing flavoprotein (pyridoxamine 5'-phosphate oxidase superfamily)/ribosomal protein S18 acetylase RimI-like enzyme
MTRDEAVRFLVEAVAFRLAGVGDDGAPVLKTLHGVVVDGWLCFHSAPKGEKTSLLGRPVVACAEEDLARIPSYLFDAERACPATTLFRSVQVHGVLTELTEPKLKASALQGLMEKLQPEGGHVPITEHEALYGPQVRGLLVAGVSLERLAGKAKLAQNRSAADRTRLLEFLWRRGAPGDVRCLELLREANGGVTAGFLVAPEGFELHGYLPPSRVEEAVEFLAGLYWNDVFSKEELRRAHLGSSAWVGVTDAQRRLVGTARAISDGGKYAWLYDVAIAPAVRKRGLGKAMVKLLLDHPAVRECRRVLLATSDAQPLYAGFGFIPRDEAPRRSFKSTELVLLRGG